MAQAPVMLVEVELTCKKCQHMNKIEVPVACDITVSTEGGALACSVVGNIDDYKTKCKKCGSAEMEVKSKKVRPPGGGG